MRIHRLLYEKDLSIAQIARALGFSREHISRVVNRKYKSRRVENLLSAFLGDPVDALFYEGDRGGSENNRAARRREA